MMHEREIGGLMRTFYVRNLSSTALAVAEVTVPDNQTPEIRKRMHDRLFVGEWAVFIKGVPGKNHDDEWWDVATDGDKAMQSWAEAFFPALAGKGYFYRE